MAAATIDTGEFTVAPESGVQIFTPGLGGAPQGLTVIVKLFFEMFPSTSTETRLTLCEPLPSEWHALWKAELEGVEVGITMYQGNYGIFFRSEAC